MRMRLPLFPLRTVLFPGLLLPVHVFEERYRALVRELLDRPERSERRFGVVAIREGSEVGVDGVGRLFEVGCTAELRRVTPYEDGRFDLVTTGVARFTVLRLHDPAPYPQADVDLLPEQVGEGTEAAALSREVLDAFRGYLAALGRSQRSSIDVPELPADPLMVSYLVAATAVCPMEEKQALLAEPDAASRLRSELRLLRRETRLLDALSAPPATDLVRPPASLN